MFVRFELVIELFVLACATVCVVLRWNRFRGTTLVAPAIWTLLSFLLVASVEAFITFRTEDDSKIAALRYLAATGTFCPLMAVLGAKRPQDTGWQWIVLSLWIVFILPVGEAFFLWQGGELDIGPAREWLLVILMFVGLGNYGLTRFAAAALATTIGQACLLYAHIPYVTAEWNRGQLWGISLIGLGVLIAFVQTSRERHGRGWNRVWTDFRDAFGIVWGLRVMERVNASARTIGWDFDLTWFGWVQRESPGTSAADDSVTGTESASRDSVNTGTIELGQNDEVERTMRTLLRRFVSPEWISDRLSTED